MVGFALLVGCKTVSGTAVFDFNSTITLDFSHPWTSIQSITTPSPFPAVGSGITEETTSGTGAFTAFTSLVQSENLQTHS
jgi:hypothetical protein